MQDHPNMVRLYDGTMVPSDSEPWRHECEIRHILQYVGAERQELLQNIASKRGRVSADRLAASVSAFEPRYILSLPTKAERNRYLDRLERAYGKWPAEQIKSQVIELHHRQKMEIAQ